MIIRMAQPWKHPRTGVFYYRARLPSDVSAALTGKQLAVEVAGVSRTIRLGTVIKVSLGTKEPQEARVRHAQVQAQMHSSWGAARDRPVRLTHREMIAKAGEWYRDLVTSNEDDPGSSEQWDIYRDLLIDALSDFENDPKGSEIALMRKIPLQPWLLARGIELDKQGRRELLRWIADALASGAETLKRRAEGDYGPDLNVQRFPIAIKNRQIPEPGGRSLSALFEGWARESAPRASTVEEWRKYIEGFAAFLGHEDARVVTKANVVAWKDHLLALGNAPKTINGSKIGALNAVFRWAVDNQLMEINPAAGVRVRRTGKPGDKMGGFNWSEAVAILKAASCETRPVYRWVPLLCAATGARVAEICQLRADDIRQESDVWFMHITVEAGSVKNAASERRIPLHPYVVRSGFLEFVRSVGKGPLFYSLERRNAAAKKPQAKIVAKNVGAWVHRLGLNVGAKARKAPNHAWRHLFRTLGRDAGVQEDILDAIMGYAATSVSRAYGEVKLATMARAVAQMACSPNPRPEISFESGYFQALGWRQGHGTERQIDRGDHRGASRG